MIIPLRFHLHDRFNLIIDCDTSLFLWLFDLGFRLEGRTLYHTRKEACLEIPNYDNLPDDVKDDLGQGSVLLMTVDLRSLASNVHFTFSLCYLVFLESLFQLSHFASNICKRRNTKFNGYCLKWKDSLWAFWTEESKVTKNLEPRLLTLFYLLFLHLEFWTWLVPTLPNT